MEYSKPHEIINRTLEARHNIRHHPALETALIERIAGLPEDDFCRSDIESLQLGAGYAQLLHDEGALFDPGECGSEYSAVVLDAFFAMRPRNRYLHDHEVAEHRKQIHEAVVSPGVGLPDPIDPYEVSAARTFLEGYLMVTGYHNAVVSTVFNNVA